MSARVRTGLRRGGVCVKRADKGSEGQYIAFSFRGQGIFLCHPLVVLGEKIVIRRIKMSLSNFN